MSSSHFVLNEWCLIMQTHTMLDYHHLGLVEVGLSPFVLNRGLTMQSNTVTPNTLETQGNTHGLAEELELTDTSNV